MVAMKSPTLALGYWNDSVNTFRTRLNGYYLTGDLMYRDEEGYFYHVDRASDALDLGDGKWLYTVQSEERILRHCPDVRDCTLLAVRGNDGGLTVDVLLALTEDAAPDRDREAEVRAALGWVEGGEVGGVEGGQVGGVEGGEVGGVGGGPVGGVGVGPARGEVGKIGVELPLRVVAVPESEMVLGPTGKVRKFLMRQRLLASTGAS
jgi:acyl-CoA synthetase (AMP-forming)/AMP-acid ligase II